MDVVLLGQKRHACFVEQLLSLASAMTTSVGAACQNSALVLTRLGSPCVGNPCRSFQCRQYGGLAPR